MHLQLKLFFLIKIREIRNSAQLFFEWSRKNDPNRLQFSRLSFNHNPFRFNIVFIPDTKPIYGHETRENDKLGTKLHSPSLPPPRRHKSGRKNSEEVGDRSISPGRGDINGCTVGSIIISYSSFETRLSTAALLARPFALSPSPIQAALQPRDPICGGCGGARYLPVWTAAYK